MILHSDPFYNLYIGNCKDDLFQDQYLALSSSASLLDHEPFNKLQKIMGLKKLFFLRQTHSDRGILIKQEELETPAFAVEGDFLITQLKDIGIGVMTADCLPIIIYDSFNHVAAAIHAGWKGTVQSIAVKALNAMIESYDTSLANVRIFFGPCAKSCCYEVSSEFMDNVASFSYAHKVIHRHNNKIFLNLPEFNKLQLIERGVDQRAFHEQYNYCTIEDSNYFSYRRQKEKAGRQMLVVALK